MATDGPANGKQRATRRRLGQAQVGVDLRAVGQVNRGERCSQPHPPAGEQDILNRGKERLILSFAPALPARHEKVNRRLVNMVGQVKGGPHVAHIRFGKIGVGLRPL